jgi:DNA (cytosine-5)-methyltransferase 1
MNLSRDQLIALCKERGIRGYSGKKKSELQTLLDQPSVLPASPAPSAPPPPPANTGPLEGMRFIDLFCGIGGFHAALTQLGATCVMACDIDEACRQVYKTNWGLEPLADIKDIATDKIPDFDILCGGFPCQAFSHAGKQNGLEDTRGTLFREIARILKDKQPAYYLLENVKNLQGHDNGTTIKVIYGALKEVGYTAYPEPIILSPHHIGVPQKRERVFLLGVRNDLVKDRTLIPFPKPSPYKTDISSVLEPESKRYPELELPKETVEVLDHWDMFVQHFKSKQVKLPSFPIWTEVWVANEVLATEMKSMPEWKTAFIEKNQAFYKEHQSYLEPWLLTAQKIPAFAGAKTKLEWQCGEFQEADSIWSLLFTFRPSGIRVKRSDTSPTLVAMAQIVHIGSRRRKLSPREVARLQSFPDTFQLPKQTVAYKQFGNSVNVEVVKRMAQFLLEMLAAP